MTENHWHKIAEHDYPSHSCVVVVFDEMNQEVGLAYMDDGDEWHDLQGDLAKNELIDTWCEISGVKE